MRGTIRMRRPSPSLIIAVIALIVAVGGGTFALAASDKKTDKKIAKKVVTNLAPGLSVKSATNATNATQLGGTPAAGYQTKVLSAVVSDTGALVRGVGAVSASRQQGGRYTVRFNRDISSCALTASTTTTTPSPSTSGNLLGYAAVGYSTAATDAAVRLGNDSSPDFDHAFSVLVAC